MDQNWCKYKNMFGNSHGKFSYTGLHK